LRNLALTGDETSAPLVNLCATWMIDHPLMIRPDEQQHQQQAGNLAGLRSIADIRNYLVRRDQCGMSTFD
jgi:hypothetical protein